MAILKHTRDSTAYRLLAYGSPEGPLLNRGSGKAGIILRVEKKNSILLIDEVNHPFHFNNFVHKI